MDTLEGKGTEGLIHREGEKGAQKHKEGEEREAWTRKRGEGGREAL